MFAMFEWERLTLTESLRRWGWQGPLWLEAPRDRVTLAERK